ncbi:hypothetical protein [Altibacter sp. HG106]|uniref:hypothetical protein n=1 Tax=Altibacter sp. HG106 TaxID=3023937 RepID=UPI002350B729|nr:hypothetical protein [Altibacter sp. HG106]MDC7994262.1 hypothetical protein [Altibacter sp. HG106]
MLRRFIVAFVVLISGITFAQEGTSSPYSFYGIGELKFKGTIENRSMGGMSVYADSIHLNIQNPASVARLGLVNYSVGGSHRVTNLKNASTSEQSTATSLGYIAIGVPMGKFGASFGLIPFSSVGYDVQLDANGGTEFYEGTGGLNKAFLTLGYQITPELSVGVDANYDFGNIENTAVAFLDDVQFGSREFNKSDILGFSFNFGLAYQKMITEELELMASATYTPETNFESDNIREVSTVVESPGGGELVIIDSEMEEVPNTDFTFPSQYTLGVGVGKPKKWFAGVEYTDQKTSNFNNRTFEITNVTFTDATKVRLGGFYIPDYKSFTSYFKRIVYRAGFRFEETGIRVDGTKINEFGITFGVGLPVGRLFSNVNVGFEFGRRGTTDFNLIQENFFNTYISLSLNDRWFQKRYYD